MAAFTGWRPALANRCGTDLAKPSWPRGRNTHAETQAAMWQGGATPQQRAHACQQRSTLHTAACNEAAAAWSNIHEIKGGAEPDGAIPSEVVDKNVQEREARGTHRRR